mmetsp:Transcript_3324/g.5169  ORF Transcript_3324/g.5169 Transcript_3324/m.5169 type:complete len:108 (+) Transcript_3324:146-469(+)
MFNLRRAILSLAAIGCASLLLFSMFNGAPKKVNVDLSGDDEGALSFFRDTTDRFLHSGHSDEDFTYSPSMMYETHMPTMSPSYAPTMMHSHEPTAMPVLASSMLGVM